jgi:hypothetical protein
METPAHQHLKRMAIDFLRGQGCAAAACEVLCPIARHRVDAAGYADRPTVGRPAATLFDRPRDRPRPRTIIIECKQSRSDYLREDEQTQRLLARREHLERLRAAVEEQRIKRIEPHLRRSGSSLFAELEVWDFERSRVPAYRRLLRRIEAVEAMLHGGTKFCRVHRYRLADRLYIAAPRGLIRPRELPRGWGLLECTRRDLARPVGRLMMAVEAADLHSRRERQLRLLRNIAVAASRAAFGPAITPPATRCQNVADQAGAPCGAVT